MILVEIVELIWNKIIIEKFNRYFTNFNIFEWNEHIPKTNNKKAHFLLYFKTKNVTFSITLLHFNTHSTFRHILKQKSNTRTLSVEKPQRSTNFTYPRTYFRKDTPSKQHVYTQTHTHEYTNSYLRFLYFFPAKATWKCGSASLRRPSRSPGFAINIKYIPRGYQILMEISPGIFLFWRRRRALRQFPHRIKIKKWNRNSLASAGRTGREIECKFGA